METSSRPCKTCKKRQVIRDDISGNLVCSSCGIVQETDNFQATFGGINGPEGTFVRINTTAPTYKTNSSGDLYLPHTDFNYKDNKIYHAKKQIELITSDLDFSPARTSEVTRMIEQITEGEFGTGNWFTVLIGACSYLTMRVNNMPMPMSEISSTIGFDLHELGRMVVRVINFLELHNIPEFDLVESLERAVRNCSSFGTVESEKSETMVKQGRFLLQCGMKWFLTTGRLPVPVVVAVLVFVAELNRVEVSFEDLAKEMHAKVGTSRKRYKELKEALVKVARVLPWGKDVTVKNVVHHAPFVLQYMEMKAKAKAGEKRKGAGVGGCDMDEVVSACLSKEVEYGVDEGSVENDSRYFERDDGNKGSNVDFGDLDNLKISQECLSRIHAQFSSEFAKYIDEGAAENDSHRPKRRKGYDCELDKEWWTGTSDLSKKLSFKEILQKDVGFNALPPSFIAGELACKKRSKKIHAAKLRINEIMQPKNTGDGDKEDRPGLSHGGIDAIPATKGGYVDWEDFIIETLLLHQVDEKEIEQGQYKRLLDLHVFNSDDTGKMFQRRR